MRVRSLDSGSWQSTTVQVAPDAGGSLAIPGFKWALPGNRVLFLRDSVNIGRRCLY